LLHADTHELKILIFEGLQHFFGGGKLHVELKKNSRLLLSVGSMTLILKSNLCQQMLLKEENFALSRLPHYCNFCIK